MKTIDFLDAIKRRHHLATDYRLGKFLRWPQGRVSMYRTGRREFDDASCVQVARALDLPAAYVLACISAARAKNDETKRAWQDAAKLLKKGAAAVILATVLALAQGARPAEAAGAARQMDDVYIMRRRARAQGRESRRRRRRRISRRAIVSHAN